MNDREELIQKYEDMMYEYGLFDVWDDDIKPKLDNLSYKEILHDYENDKKYYSEINDPNRVLA